MRHATIAVALLVASLILGGSGPYTARLSPRDLRGIRTVAVISALGNSFVFERVTDTPFAALTPPDSKFLEISDWALDPLIAKETTAALARRFTVKTIVFRPADFSTWDYALLKSSALNLNGDPAIDAYVLILRDWHWDEIGHGAHALGGLGFYRRDKPNGRSKFAVFASYRIVVVDSRSRRDGMPIEELGFYNPRSDQLQINKEAIEKWTKTGAQLSLRVASLLRKANGVQATAAQAN